MDALTILVWVGVVIVAAFALLIVAIVLYAVYAIVARVVRREVGLPTRPRRTR